MGRTKLSVVLVIVCAVKCLAMPYDELEDFAEHLKKTSQLSPTLKKGVDDDDEVVTDHAWEESGKFEGDLILNERQRRLIVENVTEGLARNGIRDATKRWPNNEVIFDIKVEHFSRDQVQAIERGIGDLARRSCVKFRRYKKGDRDAVVIQGNERGCFSQVGYQGGHQVLNLSGRHPVGSGCLQHGTIVHELLHTLGFYHMQSSPDRDDYVNIIWANIVESARPNFDKYNAFSVSDFGVGYDYNSVLHYHRQAFSSNGHDTIVPKQVGAQIGQRVGLSVKDIQKLNKMYCTARANWDNGQADESPPTKTETQTKNGKDKPFEGQGIGYHQGKLQGTNVAKVKPELSGPPDAKVVDAALIDAFDRLSKIIKMDVYPSQTPDLSVYKMDGHYTNHYDPPQIEAVSDIKFVPPVPTEVNKSEEDKMQSAIRFINNMYNEEYEPKTKNSIKEKPMKTVPDSESGPPWFKHHEEEYVSVPDFKHLEDYREKNKYISTHSLKVHKDEKPNENQDDWYQKFSQHYPDHDYPEDSLKEHEHDGDENENIYSSSIPKRTQDYSTFRFPAKVTKNWYNNDSHDAR